MRSSFAETCVIIGSAPVRALHSVVENTLCVLLSANALPAFYPASLWPLILSACSLGRQRPVAVFSKLQVRTQLVACVIHLSKRWEGPVLWHHGLRRTASHMECWFESWLLQSPFGSLTIHLGGQRNIARVFGLLPACKRPRGSFYWLWLDPALGLSAM